MLTFAVLVLRPSASQLVQFIFGAMTYKPSENSGLKENGEPDKRMQAGHVSGMHQVAHLISPVWGAFSAGILTIRFVAFVHGL